MNDRYLKLLLWFIPLCLTTTIYSQAIPVASQILEACPPPTVNSKESAVVAYKNCLENKLTYYTNLSGAAPLTTGENPIDPCITCINKIRGHIQANYATDDELAQSERLLNQDEQDTFQQLHSECSSQCQKADDLLP